MEITRAQKDARRTFLGGFASQLVSTVLWGASATTCTWHSFRMGEIILVVGVFCHFPRHPITAANDEPCPCAPQGFPPALSFGIHFSR